MIVSNGNHFGYQSDGFACHGQATNGTRKVRHGETMMKLTSAPDSAPLTIADSRDGPAREIPAVMPPFLGLLGLTTISRVSSRFVQA